MRHANRPDKDDKDMLILSAYVIAGVILGMGATILLGMVA